jgi:hypothetical protein
VVKLARIAMIRAYEKMKANLQLFINRKRHFTMYEHKFKYWSVDSMRKTQLSFNELIKKNKEELLADEKRIELIEKRLDEKYTNPKK